MTSVVDTSVKHFHSGMGGAPILNGVAGSMISLLNACLIDGFDSKVATSLAVASGVATLNFAGTHSATVDSVVLVAGSSIAALNGEQKVTAIGSGFVKFATAGADGVASGTISFKMSPAGWTQPFVGTNLATYKSADPASTGMVLRIDDTGTQSCRVVGYEQMTDINTGVGAFPTAAQVSGGGYWPKSSLTTAAASMWVLIADGRKLFLHVAPYYATSIENIAGVTKAFGDDIAYRPGGDPYACSLSYSISAAVNTMGDGSPDSPPIFQHAMPRNYTGLGSSTLHAIYPFTGGSGGSYPASGRDPLFGPFPSPIDGGLRLSKKFFTAVANTAPRSELPALLHLPQSGTYDSFKTRDTVTGTGALAGRKLLALSPSDTYTAAPASSGTGTSLVDITGPWR